MAERAETAERALLLLLPLLSLLACSPRPENRAPDWRRVPVVIELSLAQGAPGAGLVPADVYGQKATIYLDPKTRLRSAEIARVEATKAMTGTGLVLDVWLTHAGATWLANVTSNHFGDSLAVLVDSAVVTVPPIQDTVDIGTKLPISIGVPLGPDETRQLVSAVSKTWPARR